MMPEPAAFAPGLTSCYLPECPRPIRWRVTDTEDTSGRNVCDEHMPRLVDRFARKVDGPVVIATLSERSTIEDAARMLDVGATVYGLVVDTAAARDVDELSPDTRAVLAEVTAAANDSLRKAGRGPVVDVEAHKWLRRRNRPRAVAWRLWHWLRRSS